MSRSTGPTYMQAFWRALNPLHCQASHRRTFWQFSDIRQSQLRHDATHPPAVPPLPLPLLLRRDETLTAPNARGPLEKLPLWLMGVVALALVTLQLLQHRRTRWWLCGVKRCLRAGRWEGPCGVCAGDGEWEVQREWRTDSAESWEDEDEDEDEWEGEGGEVNWDWEEWEEYRRGCREKGRLSRVMMEEWLDGCILAEMGEEDGDEDERDDEDEVWWDADEEIFPGEVDAIDWSDDGDDDEQSDEDDHDADVEDHDHLRTGDDAEDEDEEVRSIIWNRSYASEH